MKIIPRKSGILLCLLCLAMAPLAGWGLRKLYLQGVTEKHLDALRAEDLLSDARASWQAGRKDEFVQKVLKLGKKYPQSRQAGEGLVILAEMAATGEFPKSVLEEVYEHVLTMGELRGDRYRLEALPHLAALDAEHGWQLHERALMELKIPAPRSSVRGSIMTRQSPTREQMELILESIRSNDGDEAAAAIVEKIFHNSRADKRAEGVAISLLESIELREGVDASLAMAQRLIDENPDSGPGAYAFSYSCDAVERSRGKAATVALLEDRLRSTPSGPIHEIATRRLTGYYLDQDGRDIEKAVLVYCQGVDALDNGEIFEINPCLVASEMRSIFECPHERSDPELTILMALERLGDLAVQDEHYHAASEYYRLTAHELQVPELASDNAETPFTEKERSQFWKGYLLWCQGERDRSEKLCEQAEGLFEPLIARHQKGWQVAQAMYELAEWDVDHQRFEEAIRLADRALAVLPEHEVITQLKAKAGEALAQDRKLIAQIEELERTILSSTAPEIIAEAQLKLAEAQFGRKKHQQAVNEFSQIWEKYPETQYAPEAMLRAAEILIKPLRQQREAKRLLEELVLKYPADELSVQAFSLLKRLGAGGG